MLISLVYSYIENYKEKDCFMEITQTKLKLVKDFSSIRFCSTMHEYHQDFKYAVEVVFDGKPTQRVEIIKSVGEFFDSEGYLHKDKVKNLFTEANKQLISKKN
mmetsp:Transcript_19618/g.22826  ORF Transcript_19618/g.22826 Transcript_19618/m.22826 type:complete len:103 (-) Transcript_19618:22-330(-)